MDLATPVVPVEQVISTARGHASRRPRPLGRAGLPERALQRAYATTWRCVADRQQHRLCAYDGWGSYISAQGSGCIRAAMCFAGLAVSAAYWRRSVGWGASFSSRRPCARHHVRYGLQYLAAQTARGASGSIRSGSRLPQARFAETKADWWCAANSVRELCHRKQMLFKRMD